MGLKLFPLDQLQSEHIWVFSFSGMPRDLKFFCVQTAKIFSILLEEVLYIS
jgi:hypothetical protein